MTRRKPVLSFQQAAGVKAIPIDLPQRVATHAYNSLLMSRRVDEELTTQATHVAAQHQFVQDVRNIAVEASIPEA